MKVMHAQRQAGVAGSERYLLSFLPALAARGVETSYTMFRAAPPNATLEEFCSRLRNGGVIVHEIDATRLSTPALIFRFKDIIESQGVDILQTNLLHADIYGSLVKRILKKPPILISAKHGYSEEYQVKYGFDPTRIGVNTYSLATKFASGNADAVFAISQGLYRLHAKGGLVPKEKLSLIPYGFDFDKEASFGPVGRFRYGPLQILSLSRLVPYKQIGILIQSFAELKIKYSDIKLVLVGDGPLRTELLNLARERHVADSVVFEGFKENVHDYLRDSDIFALPSLVEGFGRVILEAWSHAKPVVCFNVSAPNEIITDGYNGLLATPGSGESFTGSLDRLLMSEAERIRIGANGQKSYRDKFTLDAMVARTVALYDRLLSGRKYE